MGELFRSLTPPEWREWNIWGRLAYLVVLVGGIAAVNVVARWLIY